MPERDSSHGNSGHEKQYVGLCAQKDGYIAVFVQSLSKFSLWIAIQQPFYLIENILCKIQPPLFVRYCGQPNKIYIDYSGGALQQYIEDCQICCQPWQVRVEIFDEEPVVTVIRGDD